MVACPSTHTCYEHLHSQEHFTVGFAALGMGTVSLAFVRGNVPGDGWAKSRSYSGKFAQVLAAVLKEEGNTGQ